MDQVELDAGRGAGADGDGLSSGGDLRQLLGVAEVDLLEPVVGDDAVGAGGEIRQKVMDCEPCPCVWGICELDCVVGMA